MDFPVFPDDIFTHIVLQYKPGVGCNAMHVGHLLRVCKSMQNVIQRYIDYYKANPSTMNNFMHGGVMRPEYGLFRYKYGTLIESIGCNSSAIEEITVTRYIPRGDKLAELRFRKSTTPDFYMYSDIIYTLSKNGDYSAEDPEGISCSFEFEGEITEGFVDCMLHVDDDFYRFSVVDGEIEPPDTEFNEKWNLPTWSEDTECAASDILRLVTAEFERVKTIDTRAFE